MAKLKISYKRLSENYQSAIYGDSHKESMMKFGFSNLCTDKIKYVSLVTNIRTYGWKMVVIQTVSVEATCNLTNFWKNKF